MTHDNNEEKIETPDYADTELSDREEDAAPLEEELTKSKADLHRIEANDVTHLLDTLAKVLEKNDDQKVLELMWQLDQSDTIIHIREWWDRRSSLLQQYLYYMDSMPLFRHLVVFGFVEIKGWSPEKLEQREARRVNGMKVGWRLLKIIAPEVNIFKPLVKVCDRLQEKTGHLGEKSRAFLHTERETQIARNKQKNTHKKAA